jgi:hypothetical protein
MLMESLRARSREQGVALIVVLVMLVVLAIGSASFLGLTNTELRLARHDVESTRAFYAAQGGVEKAVAELRVLCSRGKGVSAGDLAGITPPLYEDFTYDEFTVAMNGEPYGGVLEYGAYKGLRGAVQKIKVTSAVSSRRFSNVRVTIREDVEAQSIPVFQFAIFYNSDDLEILPGPPMTVGGPVHCNKSIYIGSGEALNFDSTVTSVGHIYHRRKDGVAMEGGAVRARDAAAVYQEMLNPDGTWLDSDHPDWAAESIARWGGNVASAAHNVPALGFPLATPERPRAIIERGQPSDGPEMAARYYYKADLAILDDVAYDKAGAMVNLSYTVPEDNDGDGVYDDDDYVTVNPISTNSFYNYREGKTIRVTDVDIAKLRASGKFPANGILYVSRTQWGGMTQEAARLVNGAELPPQGLTVATDNPLYIQGDYNAVDKKPAGVMCDAINILSNNWQDEHGQGALNQRPASSTEVNVAIIAGNTVTIDGQYNGGVENMPRFLEDWTGVTLTYRGSLVAAWVSEIATGDWYCGGDYYTPPIRDWAYDTDLSDPTKAPPGAPSMYTVAVAHWQFD